MNSRSYQNLSLRTVPPPMAYWTDGFVGDDRDAARTQLMCNCALGLAGEAAEIEDEPSSDEIGDGYWYAYAMFHALGIESYEPQPTADQPRHAHQRAAHRAAGGICELVKKHAFHGRSFDDVREPIAQRLKAYVDALAGMDEQSADATFDQNVAKLKSRYPEGFFERG